MTAREQSGRQGLRGLVRHGTGFVIAGAIAFLTDAAVLALLTRGLRFDPLVARLAAISCAMIVGYLGHRRLTFDVAHPPGLPEFLAYAGVAWTSAAVNYAIYTAILLARPPTDPLAALFIASLLAMTVSYLGMRFGVFGRPRPL